MVMSSSALRQISKRRVTSAPVMRAPSSWNETAKVREIPLITRVTSWGQVRCNWVRNEDGRATRQACRQCENPLGANLAGS